MRKSEAKKEKRTKFWMGIFVVVLMFSSVLGLMSNDSEVERYNDLKFTRTNTGWITEIDDQEIEFNYFPSQLEYIELAPGVSDKIKNSAQMDMTSDIDDEFKEAIALAQLELLETFTENEKYMGLGFTAENEFNLPVITCADATAYVPVIMFEKSNETSVDMVNNCIILKSRSQQDFIALKDRLLFDLFDII